MDKRTKYNKYMLVNIVSSRRFERDDFAGKLEVVDLTSNDDREEENVLLDPDFTRRRMSPVGPA